VGDTRGMAAVGSGHGWYGAVGNSASVHALAVRQE